MLDRRRYLGSCGSTAEPFLESMILVISLWLETFKKNTARSEDAKMSGSCVCIDTISFSMIQRITKGSAQTFGVFCPDQTSIKCDWWYWKGLYRERGKGFKSHATAVGWPKSCPSQGAGIQLAAEPHQSPYVLQPQGTGLHFFEVLCQKKNSSFWLG